MFFSDERTLMVCFASNTVAGIDSVFDLAISIPHQLTDVGGGSLTGTDEGIALELVTGK
jgi:hypothetical protein